MINTEITIIKEIDKSTSHVRNVENFLKELIKLLSFDAEPIFKSKKWPYLY